MRVFLFLLLPFCLVSQQKIKLELKQQHEYCGGARPSPEILAKYEKPFPYANKKLIMVSSLGKVDSVQTDVNGKLSLKLKEGEYKLYEPWRYYKRSPDGTTIENYERSCLENQWLKVDILIEIKKRKSKITNVIDKAYCPHTIPCLLNPHIPE
jgi:hypothetical protein